MTLVGEVHSRAVFGRRVRVLAESLAELFPGGGTVADIGCGDGSVAAAIHELRPDLRFRGFDVLVRPECRVEVEPFDGATVPLADDAVDYALMVDVLHHTEDPRTLLREAKRVAARGVVIKDHDATGLLAWPTLRFMDWVGNAHHGVVLPYNYWSPAQWRRGFEAVGLQATARRERIPLYPFPASLVFGRRLHFATLLEP